MTSQQIEYILTIAKMRSFSKAAQSLYITQPALSQFVIALEKQLGVTLFDRSTTPISLTSAGEAFVASAEKIKLIEESLRSELADIADLKSGTLKIGTSTFRASCLLSKSIAQFCKVYKGINVSITEGSIPQLKNMVRDGELDVCIASGSFEPNLFHTEELADERLYLAIAQSNPVTAELEQYCLSASDIIDGSMKFMRAQPVPLEIVREQPFIGAANDEFSSERVSAICEQSGFTPSFRLMVKSLETVFSLVNNGLGISMIPDTMIRFGNISSYPCFYMLDKALSTGSIQLVSRRNSYYSKAAKQYCLILKQLIAIGTWRI